MVELLLPRDTPAKAGSVVEDGNYMRDSGGEGYNVLSFGGEVGDLMDCCPRDGWSESIPPTERPWHSG